VLVAKQGDIFFYDFGPRTDARIEGPHFVVVVQSDALNRLPNYSLSVVVPLSSTGRRSATHVPLEPDKQNGLVHTSYAKCEQVFTFPVERLKDPRGSLSSGHMYMVREALRITLGL